jgi:hypothetical protein
MSDTNMTYKICTFSKWYNTLWITQLLHYEACPESKIHHMQANREIFVCFVWQHCCQPWSFICEPCSFGSGRTSFVWVRCVWNGSADPKSHQMWDVFHHTVSQCKRWISSGNSQTNCCSLWWCYESAKYDEEVPWVLRREDWCSRWTKER